MTSEEQFSALCGWVVLVIFVSLLYLGSGFVNAAIVAVFVFFSFCVRCGHRWLARAGFALSIIAIAVLLGFPAPGKWPQVARTAPAILKNVAVSFYDQTLIADAK